MTSKVAVDEDLKSPRLATDLLRGNPRRPLLFYFSNQTFESTAA